MNITTKLGKGGDNVEVIELSDDVVVRVEHCGFFCGSMEDYDAALSRAAEQAAISAGCTQDGYGCWFAPEK